MQREPVSPELVLVDAELARRERTRLEELAQLKALHDVSALRRAVQSEAAPTEERPRRQPGWSEATMFARKRLVPAALLCSLLANGFFAAELLTRADDDTATQVAVRMVTLDESTAVVPRTSTAATVRSGLAPARKQKRKLSATSAAVERKLVSLIVAAPARRLPSRFVNRTTGLVKNNVQVVCRRGTPRSFLCTVRLPTDKPKAGISVRYTTGRNGKEVFRWSGDKRG